MSKIIAVPVRQRDAFDFVSSFHRHNKAPRGSLFQIGASNDNRLVGVAIVGRPVARALDNGETAEVIRLCVLDDAPKGTCSFLYGACWRAARELGWRKLITYTLTCEGGASLRGAGWRVVAELAPRKEGQAWAGPDRSREWQPVFGQQKLRWEAT